MPTASPPALTLHTDRAARSAAEDRLDVAPFARRLVGPLLHAPADGSLVVALYGPWGYGKTSALQFLEEALVETQSYEGDAARRTPYAAVARFTPWLYSSVETLLPAFFDTLAGAVGGLAVGPEKQRDKARRAIKAVGEFVGPTVKLGARLFAGEPGQQLAGLVADALQGGARGGADLLADAPRDRDEARFRRRRDKAAAVLRGLATRGRPIRLVMTIDDLDREAGADEVLALLKLVKLAADLPNVSYVIAMDRDHVEDLLAKRVSARFGREYLDKIVQVAVTLPPLEPRQLSRLLVDQARVVAAEAGLATDPLDVSWDAFYYEHLTTQGGFERALRAALRTPRDVTRILNAYRFAALTGEPAPPFHAADLLLLCALQVTAPRAYDAVRINRRFLLREESDVLRGFGRNQPSAEAAQAAREARLAAIARADGTYTANIRGGAAGGGPPAAGQVAPDRAGAAPTIEGPAPAASAATLGILRQLFPRAGTPSDLQRDDEYRARRADRDANRLRSPERFDTYFRLTPPPHQAPTRLVDAAFVLLAGRTPGAELRIPGAHAPNAADLDVPDEPTAAGGAPRWVGALDALAGGLDDATRDSLFDQIGDRAAGMPRDVARAVARRLPTLAQHAALVPAERVVRWADDVVDVLARHNYVVGSDGDVNDVARVLRAGGGAQPDDGETALATVLALVDVLDPVAAADYAERRAHLPDHAPLFDGVKDGRRRVAEAGLRRAAAFFANTPDVFDALTSKGGAGAVWDYRRLADAAGEAALDAPYPPLETYLRALVGRAPWRLSDVLCCVAAWSDRSTSFERDFAEVRRSLGRLVPLSWIETLVRQAAANVAVAGEADVADAPAPNWPALIPAYVRRLDAVSPAVPSEVSPATSDAGSGAVAGEDEEDVVGAETT